MHAAVFSRSRRPTPATRASALTQAENEPLWRGAGPADRGQRADHVASPGMWLDFAATPLSAAAAPPGRVQCKLTIGAVDDPLEHEAEHVADRVMSGADGPVAVTPAPLQVSRACAACQQAATPSTDDEPEKGLLQRAPEPGASGAHATQPPGLARRPTSPDAGQPLPGATRQFMEARFGADFSAVRIHTGPAAHEQALQLNAQAFTIGRDIHFRQGRFEPHLRAGRHLLAHELTHTLQQGFGVAPAQRETAAD